MVNMIDMSVGMLIGMVLSTVMIKATKSCMVNHDNNNKKKEIR